MMDWAAPDAPLKLMGTIAAVGAAAASFPTDVVSSVRPAYLFRNLECMMKFSQAFIIWSTDNKEDRAVKLYPCVILRGIFISVSAIEDLCADKTEYPLLDYGTLWLYETNRWLSWGGDVANAITLQSRGTNQVSAATYIVTTMVVFVASEFLVADRGDDYDQGAHVPPIPQPM